MRWNSFLCLQRTVAPVEPVGPVAPVAPVEPGTPMAPVTPLAPVAPVGPCAPLICGQQKSFSLVSLSSSCSTYSRPLSSDCTTNTLAAL